MRIYRIRKFPTKLFLLILLITIVLLNQKIFSGIKNFTFDVLTKPLRIFTDTKSYFTRLKNLSNANMLLRQQVATLSVTLARMEDASLENARLRALVGFEKRPDYKTFAAKVIARDSVDWRRAVIINKGKKDGIRMHMPCATTKGLVGGVVEVSAHSSKVMLITDPNSNIGVVLESSRESGLLIGSSEGVCKVIYLSLDGEIEKGENVLTAGFGPFFPKGLAVGRVNEIGLDKTNLYKYALVDIFENMNRIEELICIDTK